MAESLRRRSTLAPAERAAVDECGTIESSDSEALKRTPCRTRVGVSGGPALWRNGRVSPSKPAISHAGEKSPQENR